VSFEVRATLAHGPDDRFIGYAPRQQDIPGCTGLSSWLVDGTPDQLLRCSLTAASTGHTDQVPSMEHCPNCGAMLADNYCGQCGQRAQSGSISVPQFIREVFGDLFDFDSRLWRTLIPLTIRPGFLTAEYLRGRRTHYMPPFRLYLVTSLIYFTLAVFNPVDNFSVASETNADGANSEPETALADVEDQEAGGSDVDIELPDCELSGFDTLELPAFLAQRLTKERAQAVCIDAYDVDGRKRLVRRFVESIPTGLFMLLPLIALALLLLHLFSSRRYVDHLVFVLHFHTACFVLFSMEFIVSGVIQTTALPEAAAALLGLVTVTYIPVYLFRALRRVYGHGRFYTAFKWTVLLVVYLLGISLIVLMAALNTVLTA